MVECIPVDNKFVGRYADLHGLIDSVKSMMPDNTVVDVKHDYIEIRFSPASSNVLMKIVSFLIFSGFTHISHSRGCVRAFFDAEQLFEVLG